MGKLNALANIIRQIDEAEIGLRLKEYQRVLVFDLKKNEVTKTPGVFNKILRSYNYYLLDLGSHSSLNIKDCALQEGENTMELTVNLRLEFNTGLPKDSLGKKCGDLIVQTMAYTDFESYLTDFIRSEIRSFSRGFSKEKGKSLVANFYTEKKNLVDFLMKALERYGFDSEIDIHPKLENEVLEDIKYEGHVEVRPKDFHEKINLKLSYELAVDKENRMNALLTYGTHVEMRNEIVHGLKDFIRDHVLLDLIEKLDFSITEPFKEMIAAAILRKYGRKINFFRLENTNKDALKINGDIIDETVVCETNIKGHKEKIKVENTIMLTIKDPAKFKNAKLKNLQSWIQEKVKLINKKRLFNETYTDIVLEKDRIEREIKEELSALCDPYGLEIDQHFVFPDVPPLRIEKDGFVKNSIREYSTSDNRVKIKLQIQLSGQIKNLRSIAHLIERKVDILQVIENKALQAVERVVRTTSPETAYLYFNDLPLEGSDGYREEQHQAKTVYQKIQDKITKVLGEYNISELEIDVDVQHSELTKRVTNMRGGLHSFKIEIKPVSNQEDAEIVTFSVDFKVYGVNHEYWHSFLANISNSEEEELETVIRTLKGDLQSKLPNLPIEILRSRDFKTLREVQTKVIGPVRIKIADVSGLNIEIINFFREPTLSELMNLEDTKFLTTEMQRGNRAALEKSNEMRIQELNLLYQRRLDLIQNNEHGYDDDAIDALDKRIKDITKYIPTFEISKGENHRKKLNSPRASSFSFDDFLDQKTLGEGEKNNAEPNVKEEE